MDKEHKIGIVQIGSGLCALILSLGTIAGYALNYKPLYAPIDSLFNRPVAIAAMAPTTAIAIAILSIAIILDGFSRK